jgi:hypothetical protein
LIIFSLALSCAAAAQAMSAEACSKSFLTCQQSCFSEASTCKSGSADANACEHTAMSCQIACEDKTPSCPDLTSPI